MKKALSITVLGILYSGALLAQSGTNKDADAKYKLTDARLNGVYKQILEATPSKTGKADLIKAQRAWLAWRDAEAAYRAGIASQGSGANSTGYLNQLAQLTDERTRQLSGSSALPQNAATEKPVSVAIPQAPARLESAETVSPSANEAREETRSRPVASPTTAQRATPFAEKWKVAESRINEDETFSLVLETELPRPGYPPGMPETTPQLRVTTPVDGSIVRFSGFLNNSQFSLDVSNAAEVDTLYKLLVDFADARTPVRSAVPSAGASVRMRSEPRVKRFSGIEGEFTVKPYETNNRIDLLAAPSQSGTLSRGVIAIPEPAAVAYALANLAQFKELQAQAVKERVKRTAFQKEQKGQQIQQELTTAKAASEQRMKEFRAGEEGKMAQAEKQKELVRLAMQEEQQKTAISNEVRSAKQQKIAAFLASAEGSELDRKIQKLQEAITARNAEERKYITKLKETYVEYQKVVAPTAAAERSKQQALSNWLTAQQQHKPSSKLESLVKELSGLQDIFAEKLGISYEDAKEPYGAQRRIKPDESDEQ